MDQPAVKRYTSHLRQTQVALTQRTIMEAMAVVLIEHGPGNDAVKEVARRANVSERTIYRHYPTKEALWDAFLLWVSNKLGLEEYPRTAEEMVAAVPPLFARFDEHEELLRACLDFRAWSDVWLRGRGGWKEGIDQLLTNSFAGLSEETRDKAGGVIHLTFNGMSWKTLKDQWGFSGEQAAAATQLSLTALFKELRAAAGSESQDSSSQRRGKPVSPRRMVEGREVRGRNSSEPKTVQPESVVPGHKKS